MFYNLPNWSLHSPSNYPTIYNDKRAFKFIVIVSFIVLFHKIEIIHIIILA